MMLPAGEKADTNFSSHAEVGTGVLGPDRRYQEAKPEPPVGQAQKRPSFRWVIQGAISCNPVRGPLQLCIQVMFLRNLTDKQALQWSLDRKCGIWRWILVNGVLEWGNLMFAIMILMDVLNDWNMTRIKLLSNAWICLVGGLISGMGIWFINERSLRVYQETKGQSAA